MSEFIEVLSKQAKADIDDLINKLEQGAKAVDKINQNKIDIVPTKVRKEVEKTARATQKLSEAEKESRRLGKALERQKERLAQANGEVNKELLKL